LKSSVVGLDGTEAPCSPRPRAAKGRGCVRRVKTARGRAAIADQEVSREFQTGTSVGLNVHATSVIAHAVDAGTVGVERAQLWPDHGEILARLGPAAWAGWGGL
jgi:hypothetical protein